MTTQQDLLQKDINLVHCQATRATCYMPQGVETMPL